MAYDIVDILKEALEEISSKLECGHPCTNNGREKEDACAECGHKRYSWCAGCIARTALAEAKAIATKRGGF